MGAPSAGTQGSCLAAASTLSKRRPPLPLFGAPLRSSGAPASYRTLCPGSEFILWGSPQSLPLTLGLWAASWPGHLGPSPPKGWGSPPPGESSGRGAAGGGKALVCRLLVLELQSVSPAAHILFQPTPCLSVLCAPHPHPQPRTWPHGPGSLSIRRCTHSCAGHACWGE